MSAASRSRLTVTKLPGVSEESMPEEIVRRYWVTTSYCKGVEIRAQLKEIGLKKANGPRMVLKTTDKNVAFMAVGLAETIIGYNGHLVKVSTQPKCLTCGAFLPFRTKKVCPDCGSRNLERAGVVRFPEKKIVFEGRGRCQ